MWQMLEGNATASPAPAASGGVGLKQCEVRSKVKLFSDQVSLIFFWMADAGGGQFVQ